MDTEHDLSLLPIERYPTKDPVTLNFVGGDQYVLEGLELNMAIEGFGMIQNVTVCAGPYEITIPNLTKNEMLMLLQVFGCHYHGYQDLDPDNAKIILSALGKADVLLLTAEYGDALVKYVCDKLYIFAFTKPNGETLSFQASMLAFGLSNDHVFICPNKYIVPLNEIFYCRITQGLHDKLEQHFRLLADFLDGVSKSIRSLFPENRDIVSRIWKLSSRLKFHHIDTARLYAIHCISGDFDKPKDGRLGMISRIIDQPSSFILTDEGEGDNVLLIS